jgi:hypothetical protein
MVDHATRNAIISRLDSAVQKGNEILSMLDEFSQKYLFDALGQMLEESKVQ